MTPDLVVACLIQPYRNRWSTPPWTNAPCECSEYTSNPSFHCLDIHYLNHPAPTSILMPAAQHTAIYQSSSNQWVQKKKKENLTQWCNTVCDVKQWRPDDVYQAVTDHHAHSMESLRSVHSSVCVGVVHTEEDRRRERGLYFQWCGFSWNEPWILPQQPLAAMVQPYASSDQWASRLMWRV